MIRIENVETYGWKAAIRGMRNPMNSWEKSDSLLSAPHNPILGGADWELMKKLVAAGEAHSKFMRMITVTLDITAPLYWWKEFDTYKIGTVANSCSTMHSIHKKPFEVGDFSHDHLCPKMVELLDYICFILNAWRGIFLETNDKRAWWQLIQLLPSSYNQRRTVQLNYGVLHRMYHDRENHKLDEWREFCKWISSLPCASVLLTESEAADEGKRNT